MTENSVQPELQLRDFMRILGRRKWIVIVCIILGLAGATTLALLAQPTYRSVARILVEAHGPQDTVRMDDDPVRLAALPNAAPDIESQIGIVTSPAVMENVFQRAGVTIPNQDDLEDRVLNVRQEGNSDILDIAVSLNSGGDAFKVASEVPRAYSEYMGTLRQGQMSRAIKMQQDKLDGEKAELQKASAALTEFNNQEQSQGGPITSSSGASADTEYEFRVRQAQNSLDDSQARLEAARERVASAQEALRHITPLKDDPARVSTASEILLEQRNVADARARVKGLLAYKNEDNPDVIAARAQLAVAQQLLNSLPKTISTATQVRNPELDVYQQALDSAKTDLAGQKAAVDKWTETVQRESKNLAAYNKNMQKRQELERNVQYHASAVGDYQKSLNMVNLRSQSVQEPVTGLTVTQPEQVSPRFARSLIVGFLIGLVLGVILALIRDRTDDKLYTLDQIQESCGVLALGRVPQAERVLALVPGTERGQSTALESYRSLRFALDTDKSGEADSIVLTSATAAEGRAEMAYNVAVEAARDLRRTILIDADMRKPSLHTIVSSSPSPGLSDYLMGKATIDEILHSTLNSYLTFIPAGSPVENPLQLLTSPEMTKLHQELQKRCDAIVFNSPSLLRYADGRAIAKIANSAILVAKKGVSRRNALRYCAEMLRRTNARLLGVVLNDTGGGASDVPYFYSTEEASA